MLLLLPMLLTAATLFSAFEEQRWRPLHQLPPAQTPLFVDDGDPVTLQRAAASQLRWLRHQQPQAEASFGTATIPFRQLQKSLEHLSAFVNTAPTREQLARFLAANYRVIQAGGRKQKSGRKMLVTAYYEPIFAGDSSRTEKARSPLYRLPEEMKGEEGEPQWERRTIELSGRLAGSELAWLNDPFDAYLLHIQGSGRIRKPDGSLLTVRYAGNNGHHYMSLGKLFVDEKIMTRREVSIPAMRRWFKAHPQELRRMLFHNPRYIFFTEGDSGPPEGSNGTPLTPGRSAAIDPTILPTGSVAVLRTRMPVFTNEKISGWKEVTRLVFPQDSGAAIQGAGRIDLFLGHGKNAEKTAEVMQEPGELYFLLWKEETE